MSDYAAQTPVEAFDCHLEMNRWMMILKQDELL